MPYNYHPSPWQKGCTQSEIYKTKVNEIWNSVNGFLLTVSVNVSDHLEPKDVRIYETKQLELSKHGTSVWCVCSTPCYPWSCRAAEHRGKLSGAVRKQREEPAGAARWVPVSRKTKTEAVMSLIWLAEAAGVSFWLKHHELNQCRSRLCVLVKWSVE